ncbi:hypothetical protein A5646_12840 [Mycobacterium sp. 1245499.0]|uniref:hypothetical protein n=1 Tax=Mycobacterium sp. 1245499.0 TaxID=1834074 RepID=UPI0007FD7236|nr:hypothetical protein [Mycobacterium sp. 1245499.0]OBL08217.1 hypothetical protein A5646_12840 [Mycobacterium sp. 1245499.0]
MATDANGRWIGFGVGDTDPATAKRTDPNWEAVTLLTTALAKWGGPKFGVTPQANYDLSIAAAVEKYCIHSKINLPVVRDVSGNAVANLAMRTKIGAYPPPPPPTHALFTVRGTGGIIGQDYTSQIAQALPGIYHEHPIDYAASMGGIPVGAANDPNAPSGDECAEQARQMLTDAVLGSTVTFGVTGYSLGTKGVILFLNDLFNPNHPLYPHRDRLVCVVLVADPWRPFGKSFYLGPVQAGQGIGTPYFTMSKAAQDALGWRCCWLVNPADLYTNAPLGGTGQVLADVEEFILGTAVSDPLGTMAKFVQMLLQLVVKDGGIINGGAIVNQPGGTTGSGGLGGILGGLLGGGSPASLITGVAGGSIGLTAGLVPLMLPLLVGGFEGLIDGISGNGTNLPTGPAADVQAAILALKFFGSGTAPHISYHNTTWGPGPQTFLQLGIQHAADYGSRVPVTV